MAISKYQPIAYDWELVLWILVLFCITDFQLNDPLCVATQFMNISRRMLGFNDNKILKGATCNVQASHLYRISDF
jgi:hypothetical protein